MKIFKFAYPAQQLLPGVELKTMCGTPEFVAPEVWSFLVMSFFCSLFIFGSLVPWLFLVLCLFLFLCLLFVLCLFLVLLFGSLFIFGSFFWSFGFFGSLFISEKTTCSTPPEFLVLEVLKQH